MHSRVARSNVLLLNLLNAQCVLIAPPTLLPIGIENWNCQYSYDLDSQLVELDAVMMLRVQQERMNAAFFPSTREYSRDFGLNSTRLSQMKPQSLILHPGPMNRGMEITAEVADSNQSVIRSQVTNGVSVRMSVLYHLLSGDAA